MYKPYQGSLLAAKVKETKRISSFDVDGCLATPGEPSRIELYAREEIKKIAERTSALVHISARTPELMISEARFLASRSEINRIASRDLLESDRYRFLTDALVVASFGCGIYILSNGKYLVDTDFARRLGGKAWRFRVLKLLYKILGYEVVEKYLALHESAENYITRRSNVWPLDFRVQIDFIGEEGLALRGRLRQKLQLVKLDREKYSEEERLLVEQMTVVDESNLGKQKYTTYLVPECAPKESMLNQIVAGASDVNHMYRHEVSLFVVGDSLTDLRAGCLGGDRRSDVEFFVPCGSELGRYLYNREAMFVDVAINWVHDSFVELSPGKYEFTPNLDYNKRIITFGDVAFAGMNLTAPESVLAYMEKYLPN